MQVHTPMKGRQAALLTMTKAKPRWSGRRPAVCHTMDREREDRLLEGDERVWGEDSHKHLRWLLNPPVLSPRYQGLLCAGSRFSNATVGRIQLGCRRSLTRFRVVIVSVGTRSTAAGGRPLLAGRWA